ncbi:DUF4236 domain-containing protein [Ferdinandcohnia sp. Marseille-Q9671]
MAFRFRKSIKIAKGVRVNFGKKGMGVSVGTRGMRYSIHSSGRRTRSVGIPGTGISYVKTTSGKKKKNSSGTVSSTSTSHTVDNQALVEEHNHYIQTITSMHQISPEPIDWREIQAMPAPFTPGEMGPLQQEALHNLQTYTPNFLERIIKKLAQRKKEKLKHAIQQAKLQDQSDYQEWQELTTMANAVLAGQSRAYQKVITESSEFEELSYDFHVHDAHTVELEFQVNGDVVPTEQLSLTKTGKVSRRKMGVSNYNEIKKDYVCSHAVWGARHLFAFLPIERCLVHVTEHALNTATGNMENQVLLSILFNRATLDRLNFERLDPSDAMENFQHHIDHLKTKGFRPVERITDW